MFKIGLISEYNGISGDIHCGQTLVFVILVNPYTYKFTQKMLGGILGNISNASGCPTTMGIGLHAIVFTLIVRYMMDFDI